MDWWRALKTPSLDGKSVARRGRRSSRVAPRDIFVPNLSYQRSKQTPASSLTSLSGTSPQYMLFPPQGERPATRPAGVVANDETGGRLIQPTGPQQNFRWGTTIAGSTRAARYGFDFVKILSRPPLRATDCSLARRNRKMTLVAKLGSLHSQFRVVHRSSFHFSTH